MEEVVIVGAGVAGLSCLNAFLDKGIQPLLLEAQTIGRPKLCGEFIAESAACQLEEWGIGPIQEIDEIELIGKKQSLLISKRSGAMNRCDVELQLAARARRLGARIEEQSLLVNITPNLLTRAYGETIKTKQLIIATGRLPGSPKPNSFPYVGLKAHYVHDSLQPRLKMHLFGDGYFGTVPISPTTSNIACLVKKAALKKAKELLPPGLDWLEAPIPEFGLKHNPDWPDTYFIGDSLANLPPAVGGGFNLAIHSSLIAVDYCLKKNTEQYRAHIHATLSKQIWWAKLVHQAMMSPVFSAALIRLFQVYPQGLERVLHHIGLSPTLEK